MAQQRNQETGKLPIAWCFGYGSLVESYHDRAKYVEVSIPYRRVWNAWNTKARATFLGLEKTADGKKTKINGVIYPIYEQEEIVALDLREQGYTKLVIDHDDVVVKNEGLNDEMKGIQLGKKTDVFTYVPETAGNKPEAWFPILQSYIDLCATGFLRFRQGEKKLGDPVKVFLDTTYGWSKYMLNDRVLARRPWVFEDKQFVIDDYLDDDDDVHDIPAALYPTDFTVRYFREIQEGLMTSGTDRKLYVKDNMMQ